MNIRLMKEFDLKGFTFTPAGLFPYACVSENCNELGYCTIQDRTKTVKRLYCYSCSEKIRKALEG
jgi:hypothetical protein